jgi:thioredoxin 1
MVGSLYAHRARRVTVGEDNHLVLTDLDFDQQIGSLDKSVLVDFWAPWCGPCRMLAPVIDEISIEYAGKLAVGKVNTDENQKLASKYGIMSIPTLIVFKAGKPVDRIVGYMSKKDLKARLDKHVQ